jgi:hypothetical protein
VIKDSLADVFDFAVPPVIAAVIFREDYIVEGGP